MTCCHVCRLSQSPTFPFLTSCLLHTVVTIITALIAALSKPPPKYLTNLYIQISLSNPPLDSCLFFVVSYIQTHSTQPHPSPPCHHPASSPIRRTSYSPTPSPQTKKMCIPHIDIIPTPAPPHRHQKGPLPRIPLSIESIKPPETNYVSFSPKIIYRAPSSPRRSSLPPTHRPKCERSPEVEFLGGFIAGREALVREQEREKGRAAPPPAAPAPIPIPVPAPPPPPPVQ